MGAALWLGVIDILRNSSAQQITYSLAWHDSRAFFIVEQQRIQEKNEPKNELLNIETALQLIVKVFQVFNSTRERENV